MAETTYGETEKLTLKTLMMEAYRRGNRKEYDQLKAQASKGREFAQQLDAAIDTEMKQVTVDPLAGFRKGGPGILPNMRQVPPAFGMIPQILGSRQLEPRTYEEAAPEREEGVSSIDPYAGVAGIGRGFSNLLEGSKQIGSKMTAATGRMMEGEPLNILPEGYSDEQDRLTQTGIREQREREDVPYGNLKRGIEGSMELAEIVGETAPFLNVPVPRLAAPFTPGFVRTPANVVARATPEVTAGALEAGIPYAQDEDERASRMQGGAVGGYVASKASDYFAKRSNARNQIMNTEDLQEIHDMGKDFGIPVRTGYLGEQTKIAGNVAEATTAPARSQTALGEAVQSDLSTELAGKEGVMDRQYEAMFEELDAASGYPLQRGKGGRILPAGGIPATPIEGHVDRLIRRETGYGTQADPVVLAEYDRWTEMKDGMTFSDLHRFRKGLRERVPKTNTHAQEKYAELDAHLSEEIADHADRIVPGSGNMLRKLDTWYDEELPRLRKIPAIANVLNKDASPDALMNYMMGPPDAVRREMADMMSGFGKQAMTDAFWNKAYKSGLGGAEFNPLQYAKFIEQNMDSAALFLPVEELQAFKGLGRVMRHISAEGRATDIGLTKLVRGWPFWMRSVANKVERSNFVYMMANVPPDIKPGSPEMERVYRGIIRGLSTQESGEVAGPAAELMGVPTGNEAIDYGIGRLESMRDSGQTN